MANPPNSSTNTDAFENELPSDRLSEEAAANRRRVPPYLPTGSVPPTQHSAQNFEPHQNGQTPNQRNQSARYNDSFTVDYNPDPDYPSANDDSDRPALGIGATSSSQHRVNSQLPQSPTIETPLQTTDEAENGLQERYKRQPAINPIKVAQAPISVVAIAGSIVVIVGFTLGSLWLTLAGSIVTFIVSLRLIAPTLEEAIGDLSQQQKALFVAIPGLLLGIVGLVYTSGIAKPIARWGSGLRWDIISALGDFLGAIGQILIAVIAVYVAWRQYIISRDLTVQQNLITQQQTIDSYFQGISELVLDDEGLLEDWPQERVIAEARTAAILSSVDASGKAKVLRFLSRSKLLTPLARDKRLGRPILDGLGGYAEDRPGGTRVIDLGVMLAASNLVNTDLRWLDLSDANLIRADLTDCDLVRTNLARAILCDANLTNADIMGAQLFYGNPETATPRTRQDRPDFNTGEFTGTVIEGADLSNVQRLSETQRRYCCEWGGSKARSTIPGGCEGIPNRLGR